MQNLLGQRGRSDQPTDHRLQVQRLCGSNPLPVPQVLGSHSETGEATKCSKPKCEIFLLEEIRVRDLQTNVPLHIQGWINYLQDY